MRRAFLLLLSAALSCASAQAHVASNGFLSVDARDTDLHGSVELAVRDVELAVGADTNGDGKVTWGELKAASPRLATYLREHLEFNANGAGCALQFGQVKVHARTDGNYAWLPLSAACTGTSLRELTITYRVLEGVDPSHRGLLTLTGNGYVSTGVLGGARTQSTFPLNASTRWRAVQEYFAAGVWHIWSGIDHLLFLISLLLPAVLTRRHGTWEPVSTARPAFLGVLKTVTAFTLAHSITLSLAALNVVHLPSRLTESVIAASIIVAALNNIFPVVTEGRARIAFAFGLLHGFGFASVLSDMGLPAGARVASLLAFNAGIEAGQLAVVLGVMPLIYVLRSRVLYRQALLQWGSGAIAAIALVWFIQRAFLPQ
jgi:hypothetical protein